LRHYEIMLLIHPDQSERARVMMERYVGIIEGGKGQVHRNEDLGRRMLAYPIAKVHKAHYMLMNVECGQETLEELVGALHFSDAVLRHLVIRREEAISDQAAAGDAATEQENADAPSEADSPAEEEAPAEEAASESPEAQAEEPADASATEQDAADADDDTGAVAEPAAEDGADEAQADPVEPVEASSASEDGKAGDTAGDAEEKEK